MYFIQPLYSKTCRSFTFPSAAAGAACGAPCRFYSYTYLPPTLRNALRLFLSHDDNINSSSSNSSSSSIFLSTRFSRATNTPSLLVHKRLLDAPSFVCSFSLSNTLHLLLLSSLSFVAHDSKNFTSFPPLFSTSTLQTSFRLIPFTYSLFHSYRVPRSHPRFRDTPSSVSSLRSFVTTQRAHLIRIICAISVFLTRPRRPLSFFFVLPPRTRVLSKQQEATKMEFWKIIFFRGRSERNITTFFPLSMRVSR